MKQKMTMILLFIGLNTIAQIKFEKGYFISNNGVKTECFIKNEGWYNNPTEFKYKISENSEILIANLNTVDEFGILKKIKYKKFNVLIDKSSRKYNFLSRLRTSKYVPETLFLKLLVEGEAELYQYRNGDLVRFFAKKDAFFKQLEYKKYQKRTGNVGENLNYIQQLKSFFPCKKSNPKKVDYRKKSLVNYFNTYNTCTDSKIENINYTKNEKETRFNILGKMSIGTSFLDITNLKFPNYSTLNFNTSNLMYKIGVELELVMAFNKQKWSAFIEPSFQSFSSSIDSPKGHTTPPLNVNYKSIEIPLGIRHYFFLNKKHKLFLNLGPVVDFPISSSIIRNPSMLYISLDLDLRPINFSMFTGIGYDFDNTYRIELRYYLKKNILSPDSTLFWKSSYNNLHISFSYNIF